MYEKFTDRARKAMQLANQEAQRFNHEYIGTEHILLGIVKEGTGVAANVFKNLNIELRTIRLEVERLITAGPEMVTMGRLPQTPRSKKAIEYAIEESRALNHGWIGTEHLLLGLLREAEGVAAQVLGLLGVKIDECRAMVLALIANKKTDSPPESFESFVARLPLQSLYGALKNKQWLWTTHEVKVTSDGKLLTVGLHIHIGS